VFADYNESVWPAQWALIGIAVIIVASSVRRTRWSERGVCLLLSALWAWMAIAYHLVFFSQINPVAYMFGAAFLVEAAMLAWSGIAARPLEIGWRRDARAVLVIVPLLWTVVGGSAAFVLGVWQDIRLIASGVLVAAWQLRAGGRARP